MNPTTTRSARSPEDPTGSLLDDPTDSLLEEPTGSFLEKPTDPSPTTLRTSDSLL